MSQLDLGWGPFLPAASTKPANEASAARVAYADRLASQGLEHGGVEGYDAGCRAELSCPARHLGDPSCLEVRVRLAGDWQFQRLIAAGSTPADAARAIRAADEAARPVRPARRRSRVAEGNRVTPGGEALSEAQGAAA
jgi:hypothetical protein